MSTHSDHLPGPLPYPLDELLDRASDLLGLTYREVAQSLRVNETTLYRWRTEASEISPRARDRLASLVHVLNRIERSLAASERREVWLDGPLETFGGSTPRQLLLAGKADVLAGYLIGRGETPEQGNGEAVQPETILSIVAEAVVSVDHAQRILFFNRGAEQIFGYTPEEVLGRSLDVLIPKRFHEVHRTHMDRFARSSITARRMAERMEVRAIRSTGEEFPAEATIAKTEGPDGPVLTVVLRDVTARKRAQDELLSRERQLAEAQKIARLGSWEWDVGSDRIVWSDELYRIYGLEAGTPVDFEHFVSLIHPEDRGRVARHVENALVAGERFDFEHRIVRPDGAVRRLHGRGEVFLDEAGDPVRMAGTGQDITEFHEASEKARRLAVEEAAREAAERAERRMAFLARASAELASTLDYRTTLKTVAELAVPEVADWCAVDLLVEGEDEIRRLAVEHQDARKLELVQKLEARYPQDPRGRRGVPHVIRTGRSEMMSEIPDELLVRISHDAEHLRILRRLGPTSYIIAPLVVRGRVLGALTVAHAESGRRYDEEDRLLIEDLARRAALAIDSAGLVEDLERAHLRLEIQAEELEVQNEELRAQTDELARAVQAKSDFMATVSHELRTPLNAIIGYTQLLEEGLPVAIPEEARAHVTSIAHSANHQLQLIDEILIFSRLQADREVVEVESVDTTVLIEEVEAIIGPLAREKGLTFDVEVHDLPGRVRTDPRKLRQILINLLGNGIKFTEEGGVVLRASGAEGSLVFRVADTGPGIPPEEMMHLFEAFWQGDEARSRRTGGTGLGLAICDRFARLLDGELTVESTVGEGSVFTARIAVERS